ncbi:hypothetical protein D1872_89880 [compost metagenome]
MTLFLTIYGLYIVATFLANVYVFGTYMGTEAGRRQNPWLTALWFFGIINILGFGSIVYFDLT